LYAGVIFVPDLLFDVILHLGLDFSEANWPIAFLFTRNIPSVSFRLVFRGLRGLRVPLPEGERRARDLEERDIADAADGMMYIVGPRYY
jgi:hypothetical protein